MQRLLFCLLLFMAAASRADKPVLLELLDFEKGEQASGKPFHISSDVRFLITQSDANDAMDRELQALKDIEQIPQDLQANKALLAQKNQELKGLNSPDDAAFNKAQDDYNKAYFYYDKYFLSKAMDDDEREEEIAYLRSKIGPQEEAAKDSWLAILEAQQRADSRTVDKKNEDGFGLEQGDAVDERSVEEKAAWDKLNKEDEQFRKIKPSDFKYNFETKKPANQESLKFIKNYVYTLKTLQGLLYKRLSTKASRLKIANQEEAEQLERQKRDIYPNELDILITKGSADDYANVDELMEIGRDLVAVEGLTLAIAQLRISAFKNTKLAQQRLDFSTTIAELEEKNADLEEKLHSARVNRNLFAYLSLSKAMSAVTNDILQNNAKGLQSKDIVALRTAFIALMHRLETWELELALKYKDEYPYPQVPLKKSVKSVVNYFTNKATDFFSKDAMPSKKQLMRSYQMALNGLSGFPAAFKSTFSRLRDAVWGGNSSSLLEYIQLQNIMGTVTSIDKFAIANPILATDLQRNLTHAYKVFMQDPKSGVLGDIISSAKIVYEIKEVENIARDWLLGSTEYLYSSANLGPPIDPAILTLVDMAEMAPYLAGAYVGASGGGTVAGWAGSMVSWIPFIGSYKPLKVLAQAAGGVAQVQMQKIAASKISREHELLASTLRRGFADYHAGKNPKEIALSLVQYQTMRAAIRIIGTARRIGAANALKKAGQCLLQNKKAAIATGAVGAGGGSLIGFVTAAAGSTALVPILIPVFVGIGCVAAGAAISHSIKDYAIPGRKETRRLKALAEQLDKIQLPELAPDELAWVQKELPVVVKNIDFKALGLKAQGNETNLQEILMAAIQEELEKKELQHVEDEVQTMGMDNAPDPELAPLKAKLEAIAKRKDWSEIEVQALISEALKMKGDNERLDEFEASIYEKLNEIVKSLKERNTVLAKKLFEDVKREVRVLRVRQMEASLVDTNRKLSQQ